MLEEALGAEGVGLGVEVRAGVRQPDRGRHVCPRRQREAVGLELGGEAATGHRHDRAQPQRLRDHRTHVALAVLCADLLGQACQRGRGMREQVEGPGEGGRRRLVSGEQQRHELVAQLPVAHRAAVLEARREQQREHVRAGHRAAAPRGDVGQQQLVDLGGQRREALERRGAAEPARGEHAEADRDRGGAVEQLRQHDAQAREPVAIGDAEDDAQDHLERDRAHPRLERQLGPHGPALDLGARDLRHRGLIAAHALAVKGRQHHAPALQMLLALEQEQRARSHDRAQRKRAPGREELLALRVERADRGGVREHHHRPLEAEEAHAEALAEAPPARFHEVDGSQQPVRRLCERRRRRPGWEGTHAR